MESQKFIDTRTGEILTTIPLSEIAFFDKYEGPLKVGEKETNGHNVEITLEFEQRPAKADVYNLLNDLMANDCLRYDTDGELDSQK